MPSFPFLKDKPPRKHIAPISPFPQSPIQIALPWTKRPEQKVRQDRVNMLSTLVTEYRMDFPLSSTPNQLDIIEWLYNRAVDAELTVKALEQEIAILEAGRMGI